MRGEGAKLYGADGKRFANEVLPRDLLTEEIRKQMVKDGKPYVWLDMTVLGEEVIKSHFPHIYEHCLEEGYDVTKDWIPVVPAQHYFMGGIHVDQDSRTSLKCLYAVGETSCNGVQDVYKRQLSLDAAGVENPLLRRSLAGLWIFRLSIWTLCPGMQDGSASLLWSLTGLRRRRSGNRSGSWMGISLGQWSTGWMYAIP